MQLVIHMTVKACKWLNSFACQLVASRAKMMAVKSISKLRGQTNHTLYPQPEGQLGECMTRYGKELGEDSLYGMLHIVI